jgi:hypothetical protein
MAVPTLLLALAVPAALATDYCSITPRHTMCQHQVHGGLDECSGQCSAVLGVQGLGQACGGGVLRRGVDGEEARLILDTHNRSDPEARCRPKACCLTACRRPEALPDCLKRIACLPDC